MLNYILVGNIFDSRCQTLTNTVNCQGIMGKGLALQFRHKYPDMFMRYNTMCKRGQLKPGMIYPWNAPECLILNAATKGRWQDPSRLEWIDGILSRIRCHYEGIKIQSLAITKIGCGNGKLLWSDVGPRMAAALRDLPFDVEIYIDQGDEQF